MPVNGGVITPTVEWSYNGIRCSHKKELKGKDFQDILSRTRLMYLQGDTWRRLVVAFWNLLLCLSQGHASPGHSHSVTGCGKDANATLFLGAMDHFPGLLWAHGLPRGSPGCFHLTSSPRPFLWGRHVWWSDGFPRIPPISSLFPPAYAAPVCILSHRNFLQGDSSMLSPLLVSTSSITHCNR